MHELCRDWVVDYLARYNINGIEAIVDDHHLDIEAIYHGMIGETPGTPSVQLFLSRIINNIFLESQKLWGNTRLGDQIDRKSMKTEEFLIAMEELGAHYKKERWDWSTSLFRFINEVVKLNDAR